MNTNCKRIVCPLLHYTSLRMCRTNHSTEWISLTLSPHFPSQPPAISLFFTHIDICISRSLCQCGLSRQKKQSLFQTRFWRKRLFVAKNSKKLSSLNDMSLLYRAVYLTCNLWSAFISQIAIADT